MKFNKFSLALLVAFFTFVLHINEANAQKNNQKINFPSEEKIQAWKTKYKVPAVGIGIIENGKIKHVKVFGEHQNNQPAPKNTIFNVASVAKPVATMLTLKLVEAGKWNLDEPLDKYWVDPDIKDNPWHKKLTTRHVLTHQTGFGNWRVNHPTQKLTFEFEPGTQFQYSGEGFEYLRIALERKFNMPYVRLLDSLLLKPLGMKDTQYWNDFTDSTRFAAWYDA